MNFEKRSDGASSAPQTEEAPTGKKPVIIYIMVLFIAAFLLMALSFVTHQRSNTEVLGKLQDSVTAMQEVQAIQEEVIDLQDQLAQAEDAADALQQQVNEAEQAAIKANHVNNALLALYTLQQQYAAEDYDACRQTLQIMEDDDLVELLPQEAGSEVTPPSQRYQQLKEAILNK